MKSSQAQYSYIHMCLTGQLHDEHFSNALQLPQKPIGTCQHELVANDIESAILSVQKINRKGSLVARTCAPTWRACGVQD